MAYFLLCAIIAVLLGLLAAQTVRVWWWKTLHGEIGRRWWQSMDLLCNEEAKTIQFTRNGVEYRRELGAIAKIGAEEWPEVLR